jgi:hypothetical protein
MSLKAVVFVLALALASAVSAQPATQKNAQGGVTVAVTPTVLATAAKVWAFKVAYDTHTQDLSDDVPATAVLSDGKGREAKALGWEGARPGGHHREGILKFAAFDPVPAAVELRIARPGEAAPRTFRWSIK